jgi:signal transduction histidine kinase
MRVRAEFQEKWAEFQAAVTTTRELVHAQSDAAARASFEQHVAPARRQLLEHVTTIIQANATRGRELAKTIRERRQRTVRLSAALNVLCGALALIVAWLLHRQALTRRELMQSRVEAIEQRAEELEQFAGRVAHDIRNPLAAAKTAAVLAHRRAADDVTRDLNQRIVRSIDRAEAITTDLLDFARSGARPDPGARTAVRAMVEEVIADLGHDAERNRIELRAEPLPNVAVACSKGVYLSLLGNLVRNAIKYMAGAPERRITVRVIVDGDLVRTEVVDTGPGIAPAHLESLFQPYFRASKGKAEGLGLGLATVKRLADSHGGGVGVTSVVGRGSTFSFALPRTALDDDDETSVQREELEPATRH